MPALETQVAERILLLSEIVSFVGKLLREIGTLLERQVESCHTHQIRELRDFEGFSFWSDTGQTMFGGNDFKIWYVAGPEKRLVLDLYFQATIGEAEVKTFDPKADWLKALKRLIKNKDRIIAKSKKQKEQQEAMNQKRQKQEVVRKALELQATRLGLNV